ncbi:kielin/chordin-like protein isoform X2 [Mercenaria mercenaria]|uniref:kielin/chordin-like protein isoform X2 n=1 Tax=Mercenaria mercenaria TaxID=6596 RepID=UPI00234EA774|nr:kielin/chordin-like protein isoform X2 [Mercenaria mercenaria]
MELTFTFSVLLVLTGIAYTHGRCQVNGISYAVGDTFEHPEDHCKVCECCKNGTFTCLIKECPTLNCGISKQQNTSDGCCLECMPECNSANCSTSSLDCSEDRYAYHKNACCPSCGCNLRDTYWPMDTVPLGHFGSCNRCTCHQNGTSTCRSADCPGRLLECVNPTATKNGSNCTFECPDDHWYPRGACFDPRWTGKIIDNARDNKCMADWSYENITLVPTRRIDYRSFFLL